MNEPREPQLSDQVLSTPAGNDAHGQTVLFDPGSIPADSLAAGLAAGFGKSRPPRSIVGDLRPVLLKEAEGESGLIIKPQSDAVPPKEQTGDRYRLDGEIARGGMGVILKGRDVDLGRDLAVKVLLDKYAHRPEVARRFIEEAQISGQLQHPGVVPVYDIGRFGDRPFFTMKLIKGLTLAAILLERADPAADRPRLLGIMLQVAQTLAYAHAKGVIHRDLKPANIMVGAFGEVQVMDWGLAKVLAEGGIADEERASRTHQEPQNVTAIRTARSSGSTGSFGTGTEAGSLLGTPAYMPPEQANGDVTLLDRRADVFGLGAILCEILNGKPPYVGRSGEEVRRKAANGDLADATARLDTCGADQELIILTKACLAPEAIDRPKDAQAVADRLSAYLNGVQERLQTAERERAVAVVRATEERRRQKVQFVLAASIVALTALGGLSTTYFLQQRHAQVSAIDRVVGQAIALRDHALAQPEDLSRWQVALAAVEQAKAAHGEAAAIRLLALRAEIQAGLDAAQRDKDLLDRVVDIRSAEADDADGFITDRGYAEAFRDAGIDVTRPAEAGARIKFRTPSVALAIAAALDDWAAIRRDTRNDAPGAASLSLAARLADPDPWRTELRTALDEPDNGARRTALLALQKRANYDELGPISMHLLAAGLFGVGSDREDETVLQSALVLRKAHERYPRDVWINYELGNVLSYLGRRDEAIRFYTAARAIRPETAHELAHRLEERGDYNEAVAVFRDLQKLRPENVRHVLCLGEALELAGRSAEAKEVLSAVQPICRTMIQRRPDDPLAHAQLGQALSLQDKLDEAITEFHEAIRLSPDFATAYGNLGCLLVDRRADYPAGEAAFRSVIRIAPDDAAGYHNLGNALFHQDKFDEAIASYHQAIKFGMNTPRTYAMLGNTLTKKGQLDEAVSCHRKATAFNPESVDAHCNLGEALQQLGQLDEAITCFRKAIALDPSGTSAHYSLASALIDKDLLDEAMTCCRKFIELNPSNSDAFCGLGIKLAQKGEELNQKGQFDESIIHYQKAIELKPDYAMAYSNLGVVLLHKAQIDEATDIWRKAIELDPNLAPAHINLGNGLERKGQIDEAIACYKKAIELDPLYPEALCNLGQALGRKGRFAESLVALKKGHELGAKRPGWGFPSAEWLRQAEAKVAMEANLPALLNGEFQPEDNQERLDLAQVCRDKRLHRTAVRLYAAVFAADPMLADELGTWHRYNAACYAALAAAGQAEDASQLDDTERTRLRRQALDWLRADLALLSKQLESNNPADIASAQRTLRHWQQDTDLAPLRDAVSLAKISAHEQQACTQLWSDVAALLQ